MTKLFFEYESTEAYLDPAKHELFAARLPEARAARLRSPRSVQMRASRAAAEAAFRRACRAAGEVYTALRVAYTDNGKPYIEGRRDLAVNFSHTAHLGGVVLVKSEGQAPDVGLDIASRDEMPRRAAAIMNKFFSENERAELPADLTTDTDAFLHVWCRMEARVKMTGEGIGTTQPPVEPREVRRFMLTPSGVPAHHVAIALSEKVDA